ncbi:antirestriction protein ArdA [Paeniglutamicibacter sp. NPDC091659]|uniref:antirestriction protein ArdA n=1 Tax=Paeniglutamicibacter sp. NPDC091659 TaxID=3364389 RepID=UPI00381E6C1C
MERLPQQEPEFKLNDDHLVALAIIEAIAEEREITDAAARVMASQLHGGQWTALYELASTGSIDEERLPHEFVELYNEETASIQVKDMVNLLGTYCINREDKGSQSGWSLQWIEAPEIPEGLGLEDIDDPEIVAELVHAVNTHGEAMTHYLDYIGYRTAHDVREVVRQFPEHFHGKYESMEDYVIYILGELGQVAQLDDFKRTVPEDLIGYLNWDTKGLAEDWSINKFEVVTTDDAVFVYDK